MSLTDDERRSLAAASAKLYAAIREAAEDAFDAGREYLYCDATMTTHRCRTMHDLARATRAERKRACVRWREDG